MSHINRDEMRTRGHGVWVEVDTDAISHNVGVLGERASGAEVMGVVKGYAYGHGNPESAQAMLEGGATRIGVARVAEALHLRDAGITAPVHVFTEPPFDAAATMAESDLTPTIYTEAFARALSGAATALGRRVPVHVKLDTGMHRVGLPADETSGAIDVLKALPGIEIEGAWSHLAVADSIDHPFTRKQLDLFIELIGKIEAAGVPLRYKHLANSAATMSLPESHFDLVRCGIAAYGLLPGPDFEGMLDLRPALAMRARVNMVKDVPAGERLSYGLRYELKDAGRVVTVPAGYADGYARGYSGRADVIINGKRYCVSGTVCMDQFLVDVGPDHVEVGDIVTLIGSDGEEEVTADELAAILDTINYEVTSRIPSRVPRFYGDR